MNAEEVFGKLQTMIAEHFGIDKDEITRQSSLVDDLGADSVDLIDFVMEMEEQFGLDEIPDEDYSQLKTVGDCVDYLVRKAN
ncbi:MAG: acyl carrier protein [Oscillospiraceae bacterium]|nr:acyl carrier protein [Oscillospiraceae bacterium]